MTKEFPKMLYKDGRYKIAHTKMEMDVLTADQWGEHPDHRSRITIEEARAKVSYYMDGFEKWNAILKGLEAEEIDPKEKEPGEAVKEPARRGRKPKGE